MKAALGFNRNTVITWEVPPSEGLAPHEAMVATQIAAVCNTDFHILSGDVRGCELPVILGHEVTGIVTKVGSDVKGLEPGSRIVLEPTIGCGGCFICKEGLSYLCTTDWNFVGGTRPGGMAESFCAPADHGAFLWIRNYLGRRRSTSWCVGPGWHPSVS